MMDLGKEAEELVRRAEAAAGKAWAPYSGFRVGAAIRGASGAIHVGVNVENASYGLTMCAERVALGCAVSAGEREFTALAIAAAGGHDAAPCGACRQALAEFSPRLAVYYRDGGRMHARSLEELLPDAFHGGGTP
ncbi:MAG: cytidine deaminase [Gaiellales bacterium]|nr:MAG: cytidine deaminase [Gaiellales bacterium]